MSVNSSIKILVLRFSAMGDVALLAPVLRSLVHHHKNVEVTVATRPRFAAFFDNIERVSVFNADVDKQYKGLFGLRRLFRALIRRSDYDLVIDVHDHLRTAFLRNLFRLAGKKVVVFKKGRKEKKAFTRKENKITKPLPHTVERYKDAFEKSGFKFSMVDPPYLVSNADADQLAEDWIAKVGAIKEKKWIGVAPFALHKSKIWPLANYPKLIDLITSEVDATIFLFGGGAQEIRYFEDLKQLFPDRINVVAGNLKLPEEISLMRQLDLMICTDSSNMHIATLAGCPILSIWGGTHPDVGFGPFQRGSESIIQISRKELPCIPCSVFGKESCHRGDFACMNWITPEQISTRVLELLKK